MDLRSQSRRGKLGSRMERQQPAQNIGTEYSYYGSQPTPAGPPVTSQVPSYTEYQQQTYGLPQQGYNVPQQSYGMPPGQQPGFQAMPSTLLQDPMVANMAMSYGQTVLGQGKEYVDQKLEKYVSGTKLKYYFAVDTAYVLKKLGLLFFPFTHKDWSLRYSQDEPVQPRHEVNAPDLYIPIMAYVTYILVSGLTLGIQQRFSPEQLGMQASSALVWLVIEMAVISLTIYIFNIKTQLNTYHLLAICSYKFVGMIASLLASSVFASSGYYAVLIYCSIALAFFMVRSLKLLVLKEGQDGSYQGGRKRSMYILLLIGGLQPILMFWLTWKLATFQPLSTPVNSGT